MPAMMRMGAQPTPPQMVMEQIREFFDVKTLEKAAQAFEIQYGRRPESLQELVTPPSGTKPFVEQEALNSPLGPYQYEAAGTRNNSLKPDVWAITPTGEQITDDDSEHDSQNASRF